LVIAHIIIGIPPHDIIIGMPTFIMLIIRSQDRVNISIVMPPIGFISQVIPSSVMVQVFCAIIIGIMGFIIGIVAVVAFISLSCGKCRAVLGASAAPDVIRSDDARNPVSA
jgi:hypothetical protein